VRWGRTRATSDTGGRLSSPVADWWQWHGRGDLQRASAARPRRYARSHVDSGEARGGGCQHAAMEALLGFTEEVGMVGRRWKLAEARAHGGGNCGRRTAVCSGGSHNGGLLWPICACRGIFASCLSDRHVKAWYGEPSRRAVRRRRGERAHTAWCTGSPAESRPGGACGADAQRAHYQTPSTGHGTVAHGGGASGDAWRRAEARDVARSRPGPSDVPLFACSNLKTLHVNFTSDRYEHCRWIYPLEFG
jgi:hypothetical protein